VPNWIILESYLMANGVILLPCQWERGFQRVQGKETPHESPVAVKWRELYRDRRDLLHRYNRDHDCLLLHRDFRGPDCAHLWFRVSELTGMSTY
jgi:hypothetical protein